MNEKNRLSAGGMIKKSGMMAVVCLAVSGLFLAGCAKVPEKLISPTLKIEPVMENNKPMYKMMLSAGIQNENNDVAFVNVKGTLFFTDPGKSDTRVFTVPFELPVILPFDTGIIELEKSYTEGEIMPLLRALGSNREKLANDKVLERSFTDARAIGFELNGYEKMNILDVLKEKMNEKNR
jgi:hypothetical protein